MSDAASPPDGLAVTGSTGRIGRMLRSLWSDRDVAWVTRADALAEAFAGRHCVIGLAGVTQGDPAALRANSDVALATLMAATEAGVARVLLFSSAAVYGRSTGRLDETCGPTPAAPYGVAKSAMEAAVTAWRADHPDGSEAVILRLGNVAGADALLSRLTATPPDLDIFPDGRSPRRSYIGPVMLAQTLASLAAHAGPLPPVLNVAAPRGVEMAALLRAAGRDWTPKAPGPSAIADVTLETGLLQSLVPVPRVASDPAQIIAEWRSVSP